MLSHQQLLMPPAVNVLPTQTSATISLGLTTDGGARGSQCARKDIGLVVHSSG